MASVDVIIPLYNKENTVARTLASVLNQTFGDWRMIVVDDGSTDQSVERVRQFDDPRITLLHQENRGPGAARNTGIKAANADYVAFLDADDQWYPWYLENAVSAIRKNPVALVGSYFYEWPKQADMTRHWQKRGVREGVYQITGNESPKRIEAWVFFFHVGASIVHRQTALRYGGFYEQRCAAGEDTIFFSRLVLNEPFMIIGPAAVRHNRQDSRLSVTQDMPLNPAMLNPELVMSYCPQARKKAARLLLVRWALLTAHHKARNGFKEHAVYLLEHFPEARRFRLEYLRCRLEILLSRWMPYWVKFKCAVGPLVRLFLKKVAIWLGLLKKPPEMP
jgi:glycosyltransferase involved in cell wall biosynthesis